MYQPFKFIFVVGNILKVPICTTFYLFSPKEIMVQGQERSVFTNVMCALCGSSSGAIAVQFYIALRGVTLPHKTWNILSPGDIYSLLAGINRHLKQIEIEAILTTDLGHLGWVSVLDSFTCTCSIFANIFCEEKS